MKKFKPTQTVLIILFLLFLFPASGFSQGTFKHLLTFPEFNFNSPTGIEVDLNGNIYVSDRLNDRVQVFEPDGMGSFRFRTSFGSTGSGDGQFSRPRSIALDSDGNVYVADFSNDRVQVFEPDGTGGFQFRLKFGVNGSGELDNPSGIDLDPDGNVYVVDSNNDRVQVFEPDGLGGFQFKTAFGSFGSGEGEFIVPAGIALDINGNVYVVDTADNRVQVFEPDGLGGFQFKSELGSFGSGNFDLPNGITVDINGIVYVADSGNNRIQALEPDGAGGLMLKTNFGSGGMGDGEFRSPNDVALDNNGNIYITDTINNRIQVFEPDGAGSFQFKDKIESTGGPGAGLNDPRDVAVGSSGNVYIADAANDRIVILEPDGIGGLQFKNSFGSSGFDDGQFRRPFGIAVDSNGDVYVTDTLNNRIQVLEPNGSGGLQFKTEFATPGSRVAVDTSGNVYVADGGNSRIRVFEPDGMGGFVLDFNFGSFGSGNGQFNGLFGIAVDSSGNVYVTESQNDRIQVLEPDGSGGLQFKTKFGTTGTGEGQFIDPFGLTLDSSGNVYVSDTSISGTIISRIQVLEPDGSGGLQFKTTFGTTGSLDGQFNLPSGLTVDNNGIVYVADTRNNRLQLFTPQAVLKIVKETLPGGGTDFDFTSSGLSGLDFCELDNTFTVDNGETKSCIVPSGNNYSVSETLAVGTVLDISCSGNVSPVFTPDPPTGIQTTGTVEFDITSADDELLCTFINISDIDGDGVPDFDDECPDDPGKSEPGICGCGTPDTDSDLDGTPDCNDECESNTDKVLPGICGCTLSDIDRDFDGTPDCLETCDTDPDKLEPGLCGCGVPEGCDDSIDNEINSTPVVNINGSTITIINTDQDNPLGPIIINIDLPDDIIAETVELIPGEGVECTVLNSRLAEEEIDISCQLESIENEQDIILGLCNNGSQQQSANAIVEILSPDLETDFDDTIEIITNELTGCQAETEGESDDTNSGCSISPVGAKPALSTYLLLLLPLMAVIRKKYSRINRQK